MSMISYDRATFNLYGPAPGTVRLFATIQGLFSGARSLGIYNARNVRGSSDTLSLHAEGRAVDVVVSDMDRLAQWAVDHASEYQIQEVIQYGRKRIWTSAKASQGWRSYKGPSNYSHIHIGQNRAGAGISAQGRKIDPLIAAESYWEIYEAMGLRAWQIIAILTAGGIIVGSELGLIDGVTDKIDKQFKIKRGA